MSTPITNAMILARGLGTRMRREAVGIHLDAAQEAVAARGIKMLIPDSRGRPFLSHLLSLLADAGIDDVCLIVAPEHDAIDAYLTNYPPQRLRLQLAIQDEPRGTANAVLAADHWRASRDSLVLNADNLYPVTAIRALMLIHGPGVVAFEPTALVSAGNINPERIASFAIVEVAADGTLARIIEKPDAATLAAAGPTPWVSMNLWRVDNDIVAACRDVPLSARGEFELPEAVALAITRGSLIRVVEVHAGVLDLSARGDIAAIAKHLGTADPRP